AAGADWMAAVREGGVVSTARMSTGSPLRVMRAWNPSGGGAITRRRTIPLPSAEVGGSPRDQPARADAGTWNSNMYGAPGPTESVTSRSASSGAGPSAAKAERDGA